MPTAIPSATPDFPQPPPRVAPDRPEIAEAHTLAFDTLQLVDAYSTLCTADEGCSLTPEHVRALLRPLQDNVERLVQLLE